MVLHSAPPTTSSTFASSHHPTMSSSAVNRSRTAPLRSDPWAAQGRPGRPLRQVDRATGLPRVLGTESARRLGLTRSAVRHAIARYGWRPLARGVVLTVRGEPTRADWAAVGLELASPQAAVSGWDVARIFGLGTKRPPDEEVLVLDRTGTNRLIAGRVRVRPTRRPYAAQVVSARDCPLWSLPIVDVERAIADCALRYRTRAPVRAMTTAAVQKGLCTPSALIDELIAGPRNGSRWLRRALDDVADGARSIAEAEAVDLLRRVEVPAFELNVPIVDWRGVLIAKADVLWRELRAIAEIDSREFHFLESDWKGTSRRHNRLTGNGLALEHYPPSEIRDRGLDWAREVESWLRNRAGELGVTYVSDPRPRRFGPDDPPPYRLPR
jgi:hypothetical protein